MGFEILGYTINKKTGIIETCPTEKYGLTETEQYREIIVQILANKCLKEIDLTQIIDKKAARRNKFKNAIKNVIDSPYSPVFLFILMIVIMCIFIYFI